MKFLAVSDQIIDRIYSSSVKSIYPDVNALVGCGDLPYYYLEFLVSIYNIPLFYVPGNHDPQCSIQTPASYAEGGTNLDLRVTFAQGLLIAGIGGSIEYHQHSPNQYTQQEMYLRVYRLLPKIFLARLRHRRPLDLLIAHSPPKGIHDDDDPAHQGLAALNLLIQWAQPRYFLHGHTMFYLQNLQSPITQVGSTQVINVYPFRVLEINP